MCISPVKIKLPYTRNKSTTYVPCGKCSACRQALANRRASKIIHHVHSGCSPYFITLSYYNHCIPYVLKSDIIKTSNVMRYLTAGDTLTEDISYLCSIPIYRDSFLKKGRNLEVVQSRCILDYHELSRPYNDDDVNNLSGIRTIEGNLSYAHPDKISVAYSADFQNFIKRLRRNFLYERKERLQMSYYFAPEYGPTTQRFHIHALLYLPNSLDLSQVQQMCVKAWPFCDPDQVRENVKIPISVARYLASYVNCDANVSTLLLHEFPLRSSHSLHFGFGDNIFTLSNILEKYKSGTFKYSVPRARKDGTVTETSVYFPGYVINKFFPRIKGYNRCSLRSLRNIYVNPQKYFKLNISDEFYLTFAKYGGISYETIIKTPIGLTEKGDRLYTSSLVDRNGMCVNYTVPNYVYDFNRILRAQRYFNELGYTNEQFADIVFSYHSGRSSSLYKDSLNEDPVLSFNNLDDVISSLIPSPSVKPSLSSSISYAPESLPYSIKYNKLLTDQFYNNIKQRKLNYFHTIS